MFIYTKANNKVWSDVVSSTLCLAFYCSFSTWYIQTIWDNSSSTMDQPSLFPFLESHFYEYKQSNAPPSTWSPYQKRPKRTTIGVGMQYPMSRVILTCKCKFQIVKCIVLSNRIKCIYNGRRGDAGEAIVHCWCLKPKLKIKEE